MNNLVLNFSSQIKASKESRTLNKPFRLPSGSKKKFGVYVKNDKGNTVIVKFGDPNMEIRRDDPERRKNFRARHGCDNPGPKWSAKYWSCKFWSKTPVSSMASCMKKGKASDMCEEWDGETEWDQEELKSIDPTLSDAPEIEDEEDDMECEECEKEECDCGKCKKE